MIAALDVHYFDDDTANAAAVVFDAWDAAKPVAEYAVQLDDIEPYEPGEFYRRELPCLRAVLQRIEEPITTVVVDGYVWLSSDGRAGLGAHLAEEVDAVIIGVAKNPFRDAESFAVPVLRGESTRPLYVTSAGIGPDEAAQCVEQMHGDYRFPTLLRCVDSLARGGE